MDHPRNAAAPANGEVSARRAHHDFVNQTWTPGTYPPNNTTKTIVLVGLAAIASLAVVGVTYLVLVVLITSAVGSPPDLAVGYCEVVENVAPSACAGSSTAGKCARYKLRANIEGKSEVVEGVGVGPVGLDALETPMVACVALLGETERLARAQDVSVLLIDRPALDLVFSSAEAHAYFVGIMWASFIAAGLIFLLIFVVLYMRQLQSPFYALEPRAPPKAD